MQSGWSLILFLFLVWIKRCSLRLHLCCDSDCNLDNPVKVSGGCLQTDCCHGDRGGERGWLWIPLSKLGSWCWTSKLFHCFVVLAGCIYLCNREWNDYICIGKHKSILRLHILDWIKSLTHCLWEVVSCWCSLPVEPKHRLALMVSLKMNMLYKSQWERSSNSDKRHGSIIHPPMHPSIHPCIHPSIHPCIHPSVQNNSSKFKYILLIFIFISLYIYLFIATGQKVTTKANLQ